MAIVFALIALIAMLAEYPGLAFLCILAPCSTAGG
jgi:hypothetical protein